MRGDYSRLVPINFAADGKTIVSYPTPGDISAAGAGASPQKLHKGYYIDNLGVNEHTAFLNMSYKRYSTLKETPSLDQLYKMILAKDGITRICDCGVRSKFSNPKAEINKMIDNGSLLKKCKALK